MKNSRLTHAVEGVRDSVPSVAVFDSVYIAANIYTQDSSIIEVASQTTAASVAIFALGGLLSVVKNRSRSE